MTFRTPACPSSTPHTKWPRDPLLSWFDLRDLTRRLFQRIKQSAQTLSPRNPSPAWPSSLLASPGFLAEQGESYGPGALLIRMRRIIPNCVKKHKKNSAAPPRLVREPDGGVLTAGGQSNARVGQIAEISCRFATRIGMSDYQSHPHDYWHEPSSTT